MKARGLDALYPPECWPPVNAVRQPAGLFPHQVYACVSHSQVRELTTLVVKLKKDEEITAPFPFVDLKKYVPPCLACA